jgi:heterodisulfide reductase subunit A
MTRRIGVFICQCGTNISDKVDIERLISEISSQEDVAVVEPYRLLCSPDGRSFLEERIKNEKLTHLVLGACSPRDHQGTFMGVCERAGVNPYLLQLANIREQCAWITEDTGEATDKALRMVRAALGRVRRHVPLERREIEIDPEVLVVGGGVAGMEAALRLASPMRKIYLVEREMELGGMARDLETSYPGMEPLQERLEEEIRAVFEHQAIEVLTGTEVERILGFFGNYEVLLRSEEGSREMKVGAVILATGAGIHDLGGIDRYGYGSVPKVMTTLDVEKLLLSGGLEEAIGHPPSSVAIVHCAGREELGYCSGFCCMESLKIARRLFQVFPGVRVTHLYSDLCVPGKDRQRFRDQTVALGAELVLSSDIRIEKGAEGVEITYLNEGNEEEKLKSDMGILSPGLVPSGGTDILAGIAGVPLGKGGFLAEQHEKLAPVLTIRDGILIAGCAKDPKGMEGSAAEAGAAAASILATLVPGRRIEPEVKVSTISEEFCQGCGNCVRVCSYGAVTLDERRNVAVVNEVICRGCGNCVASCPSGAASIRHASYDQIYQEIMEAVK